MSSKPPCDICGGARVIRLPVRRALVARGMDEEALPIVTSRVYPCPECGPIVQESHVAIVTAGAAIDLRYEGEPGFMEHARGSLVHDLAHLVRDHVAFEVSSKPDRSGLRREMVATIGVVAKGRVASIEDRACQYGLVLAKAAVEEMRRQILMRGWYGGERYDVHAFQRVREKAREIIASDKISNRGHHDDNREETKVE